MENFILQNKETNAFVLIYENGEYDMAFTSIKECERPLSIIIKAVEQNPRLRDSKYQLLKVIKVTEPVCKPW